MTNWKAGDVVLDPEDGTRAMVIEHGMGCPISHKLYGLHLHRQDGDWNGTYSRHRRLAVIDPEDAEAVERLRILYYDLLRSGDHNSPTLNQDSMQQALREFVNPKPERIEEPGPYGVVEASLPDLHMRRTWFNDGAGWRCGGMLARPWNDLIDPVLIRKGITDDD